MAEQLLSERRDSAADDAKLGRPISVVERRTAVSTHAPTARVLLLALVDGLALLVSGTLAFLLWANAVRNQPASVYLPIAPLLLLIIVGYAQAGLYPGFGLGPVEKLRRYTLVTLGSFVALAALTFALKAPQQYSRVTLGMTMVLSLGLVPLARWGITRRARKWAWWPEPVLLVGDGRRTDLARRLLSERPGWDFRPIGEIRLEGSAADPTKFETFERAAAEHAALSGVQVAFADLCGPAAEDALDRLRLIFPRVIILREFEELPVEGVQVRNLGGLLGLEYSNSLLAGRSRWVKRTLDLIVGTLALLAALPIMVVAIAAVKVRSAGPAFYRQEREGRRGRRILVPKIRTMVPDADARMTEILEQDPDLRNRWEAGFKLPDDPRLVPGVGRLLRRFSIDELPQLWSVVKGEMSLVGPRPFPRYHLDALSPRARHLRSQVRPGLTGLWQVTARGVAGIEVQQEQDIYYIRNWSVWLDLYVLSRTVSAVLSGRGAY